MTTGSFRFNLGVQTPPHVALPKTSAHLMLHPRQPMDENVPSPNGPAKYVLTTGAKSLGPPGAPLLPAAPVRSLSNGHYSDHQPVTQGATVNVKGERHDSDALSFSPGVPSLLFPSGTGLVGGRTLSPTAPSTPISVSSTNSSGKNTPLFPNHNGLPLHHSFGQFNGGDASPASLMSHGHGMLSAINTPQSSFTPVSISGDATPSSVHHSSGISSNGLHVLHAGVDAPTPSPPTPTPESPFFKAVPPGHAVSVSMPTLSAPPRADAKASMPPSASDAVAARARPSNSPVTVGGRTQSSPLSFSYNSGSPFSAVSKPAAPSSSSSAASAVSVTAASTPAAVAVTPSAKSAATESKVTQPLPSTPVPRQLEPSHPPSPAPSSTDSGDLLSLVARASEHATLPLPTHGTASLMRKSPRKSPHPCRSVMPGIDIEVYSYSSPSVWLPASAKKKGARNELDLLGEQDAPRAGPKARRHIKPSMTGGSKSFRNLNQHSYSAKPARRSAKSEAVELETLAAAEVESATDAVPLSSAVGVTAEPVAREKRRRALPSEASAGPRRTLRVRGGDAVAAAASTDGAEEAVPIEEDVPSEENAEEPVDVEEEAGDAADDEKGAGWLASPPEPSDTAGVKRKVVRKEKKSSAKRRKGLSGAAKGPTPAPTSSEEVPAGDAMADAQTRAMFKSSGAANYYTNGQRKVCGSCGTKNTPYWRDGWNGVCLCNACGIRYKKRKVACTACNYVPRKEERTASGCPRCGAGLFT